jgi:signal transduction histidine kinase
MTAEFRRARRPLYLRLLLWFCIANLATLLVSVFATERIARGIYISEPDWPELAQQANAAYIAGGREALQDWTERERARGLDSRLYEDGRELLDRQPPPPARPPLPSLLDSAGIELRPEPELRIAGQRVTGRDGVVRQFVGVRGPKPPHARIEELLLVQIGLSLLVIGLVGWWLARSIARPVAAIGDAARRVADGDFAARVEPRWSGGADEVGTLARDFDRMAARIEALVAHERSVLQDVSHELRSPLARLQLLLDLARRSSPNEAAMHFARAEREIERLDQLIGEALALSRMEADLPGMRPESVDLAALAAIRIEACRPDAEARALSIELDAAADVFTRGSVTLIGRVIDNLLSNAIKYSHEGGRVSVRTRRRDDRVELRVRDHGPGVPASELVQLFRPFFRGVNAARADGHGLGLAIADRIARAHGGSLTAANAPGGGLAVTLILTASA